jgi:glycosyltransferase involved in cell wall biosynthesis
MMSQQGAAAVVAAAGQVWQQVSDARFVFIGPASAEEGRMFDGADPRIVYLGKVSRQEKADALAACDVFCMPSLSEILPTVYLEAWSLGKPVVGGMAHGLRELVEGNGAGITVSQDPADVAGALIQLLTDKPLQQRLGQAGKTLVERKYSVPAVTTELLELYRALLAKRSTNELVQQPAMSSVSALA